MLRLLKDICDEEFYRELTSVIGHLRRQTNLIESMGCKCPTVADARWLSAGVVTDWLSVNRGTLIEHYSRKPERLRPSRKWRLITMALSRILREVNVVVQRLQGLTTLLSQQAEEPSLLAMEIRHMALIVSPHSAAVSVNDEEVAREDKVIATSGQDYATTFGVETFIKDLGIAAADIYHLLPDDEKAAVVASLGQVLVGISEGVRRLVSDGDNNPSRPETFPAVLPQQIVKKRPSDLLPFLLPTSSAPSPCEGARHECR
jgi:hypothetical protein